MKKLKKLLALNAADPKNQVRNNPRPVNKRIVVKRVGRNRTYLKGWVV